MYPIHLAEKVKNDLILLKKENPKFPSKVWELILSIFQDPYVGIGKPEALRGNLKGWWSRRITEKHRLIYRLKNGNLELASCYGHYGDK